MLNLVKKLFKVLLKGSFYSVLVLALVASSATLFENYLYNNIGSSVVKLTLTSEQRAGGTGFQVLTPNGNQFTLTNAHICEIAETLIATDQEGNQETIKVVEIFKDHDLCIMEPIYSLKPLKVASELSLRERVWLIGHPALRPLTLESGHFAGHTKINLMSKCKTDEEIERNIKEIDALLEKALKGDKFAEVEALNRLGALLMGYCFNTFDSQYVNNISYGGNSGSPIVNKYGRVVGVLYAGRRDQPTASYTVPLSSIEDFLKDY